MTRREYTDSMPVPQRKMTREQFAHMWTNKMKKSLLAKGLIHYTAKKSWAWSWPADASIPMAWPTGGIVEAHTRGEARAEIKKALSVHKPFKGRLPVGIVIARVEDQHLRDRTA